MLRILFNLMWLFRKRLGIHYGFGTLEPSGYYFNFYGKVYFHQDYQGKTYFHR